MLRGISVLAVVVFHTGLGVFPYGFLGVDVFFVVSGFVIYSRFFQGEENINLKEFYKNRFIRLAPSLIVVSLGTFLVFTFILLPEELVHASYEIITTFLVVPNFYLLSNTNYFSTTSDFDPYIHHWSLGVEEQFYLLFPLAMTLLWKSGRKLQKQLIGFGFCLSLMAEIWLTDAHPLHVFYLLPTRVYEFFIGIGLAAFLGSTKRVFRTSHHLLIALLILFLFAARLTERPLLVKSLVLILSGISILFSASDSKTTARALWRPLEFLGNNSYSIYLIHQPLFVIARLVSSNELSLWSYSLLIGITILLGFLITHYIEEPTRFKAKLNKNALRTLCVCVSLLLILQISNVKLNGGFSSLPHATQIKNDQFRNIDYMYGTCFLPEELPKLLFSSQCIHSARGTYSNVILWGDSHAASLAFGTRYFLDESGLLSSSSCIPVLDQRLSELCRKRNSFAIREISKAQAETVILQADWQSNLEISAASLPKTIRYLNQVSPGSRILIVGPLPTWKPNLSQVIARKGYDRTRPISILVSDPKILESAEKMIKKAAHDSGSEYLSLTELACNRSKCPALITYNGQTKPTVYDYAHLTRAGSILYGSKIAEYLTERSVSR